MHAIQKEGTLNDINYAGAQVSRSIIATKELYATAFQILSYEILWQKPARRIISSRKPSLII